MSENQQEHEICYAALAFTDTKVGPNSGGLPLKLLNRHNSQKGLWSARRTLSSKAPSLDKSQYNDDEDDTLSALPEIRLPAPPPPRTHSSAHIQTDENEEKESPWVAAQKPIISLGLVVFASLAVIMNVVVWDIYIKNGDSSSDDWCIPLPDKDGVKQMLKTVATKNTTILTTDSTTSSTTTTVTTTTTTTTTTMPTTPVELTMCQSPQHQDDIEELDLVTDLECKALDDEHKVGFTYILRVSDPHICTVQFEIKNDMDSLPSYMYEYCTVSYYSVLKVERYCEKDYTSTDNVFNCNGKVVGDVVLIRIMEDFYSNFAKQNYKICGVQVEGIPWYAFNSY